MITTRINQLKTIVLMALVSFLSCLMPKGKYWVICERGTDARDNGWHFYKYMKKHHPETKVYYIIDKKSSDYNRVKEDAVSYGSFKNYWVVARAEKLISTHVAKFVPYLGGKIKNMFPGMEKKFYFLQHGVTASDIEFLYRKNVRMKLFACGAKPERDYILEKYGHEADIVQYTGFARYDSLHDISTKKQILVMPTWRSYIRSREEFLKSDYYLQWQEIIGNEKLTDMLTKSGYELIFYPHYEFQKYLDCFVNENPFIKLASFREYDVQTLLKESALLITDYSSVFFDFGYMRKPVIYFQFDAERFFDDTRKRGYFNYETDGFGRVCVKRDEVIDEIERCFLHNFDLEKSYSERLGEFFPLHDKNNCQRIYEKIIGR